MSKWGQRARCAGAIGAVLALLCSTAAAAASAWTIVPSPSPSSTGQSFLDGVTCTPSVRLPSATTCVAVGSFITAKGTERPLIQRWDGTSWRVSPTLANDRSLASALVAVSCAKATSCIAVGTSRATVKSPTAALVERWDGTRWKVIPNPKPKGSSGTYLKGVSCPTTRSCYAVGTYSTGTTSGNSLIAHWNGSKWSVMPSPNPAGATSTTLTAVSCVGNTCWAVGSYTTKPVGEPFFTVTERLQRGKWVIAPSPNGNDRSSALNAVSCTSSISCYAVGVWGHGEGAALIEHWNGARWTVVPTVNGTLSSFTQLSGVSCTSAASCVATGARSGGALDNSTLIIRLSGGRWAIEPSAEPKGAQSSALAGVSCRATACVTVGAYIAKSTAIASGFTEHHS